MPPPTTAPTADDAGGAKQGTVAAERKPSDLVRVYNRARKQYSHEIYKGDPNGLEPRVYVAGPNSFITLPRLIAEKWLAMFPQDILAGDEALKTIDATQAELIETKAKMEALDTESAALKAELAEAKRQLAEARGGI